MLIYDAFQTLLWLRCAPITRPTRWMECRKKNDGEMYYKNLRCFCVYSFSVEDMWDWFLIKCGTIVCVGKWYVLIQVERDVIEMLCADSNRMYCLNDRFEITIFIFNISGMSFTFVRIGKV